MYMLLLAAILATLVFVLARQWGMDAPTASAASAHPIAGQPAHSNMQNHLAKLEGWPRHLLILFAATALAFLIVREALAA